MTIWQRLKNNWNKRREHQRKWEMQNLKGYQEEVANYNIKYEEYGFIHLIECWSVLATSIILMLLVFYQPQVVTFLRLMFHL